MSKIDNKAETEKFFRTAVEIAVDTFKKAGEVPIHIVVEFEDSYDIVNPFGQSKESWLEAVRAYFAGHIGGKGPAIRYAMTMEAWAIELTPGKVRADFPPNLEDVDLSIRKELVTVTAEDKFGNFHMARGEIIRDADGKGTLKEPEIIKEEAYGQMVRLLSDKAVSEVPNDMEHLFRDRRLDS